MDSIITTNEHPVIAVVGLGLLGASICQTLKDRNFPCKIIGLSSPTTTEKALQEGIIDSSLGYHEIGTIKDQVDLVFLCTPIAHIFEMVDSLSKSEVPWKKGCIVTDVGSTKSEICQFAWDKLGEEIFIGGHPMAGSEKNGLDARDTTLFESALWLITPAENQTVKFNNSLLYRVIQTLGASIHTCGIESHDKWLAAVSHLPQLLSSQLSASTHKHIPEAISVAGPGYRDMSRLALSAFPIWQSILETNSKQISLALANYIEDLKGLKNALDNNSWDHLESTFENAYKGRQDLHIPQEGWSNSLIDVIVSIKDQKGMISKIIDPLSEASLDIRDIQLLKIREGSGGTLRISFPSIQQAKQAVELLGSLDIYSQLRSQL